MLCGASRCTQPCPWALVGIAVAVHGHFARSPWNGRCRVCAQPGRDAGRTRGGWLGTYHAQTQVWAGGGGQEKKVLHWKTKCGRDPFLLIIPPHQGLTRLLGFFQSICWQSPSAPIRRHLSVTGHRETGEGAEYILENIKTTFWNV